MYLQQAHYFQAFIQKAINNNLYLHGQAIIKHIFTSKQAEGIEEQIYSLIQTYLHNRHGTIIHSGKRRREEMRRKKGGGVSMRWQESAG